MDRTTTITNKMAEYIEIAEGVDKIHQLQLHDNQEIYKKAYGIIDRYFNEDEGDAGVDENGAFGFPTGNVVPTGGFSFQ